MTKVRVASLLEAVSKPAPASVRSLAARAGVRLSEAALGAVMDGWGDCVAAARARCTMALPLPSKKKF